MQPLVEYWTRQLAGAPPLLELPIDRPRPTAPTFRGAREFFSLSQSLVSELSALGRRQGCTLYMVLLAAFNALIGRRAGKLDIVIGSPIANRNHAETEALIGPFMNTLALRTDLRGDPPFTELLARVRKTCLDSYAHQDLPFERLVAELQPARATRHSPVFQVMFILQNTPTPTAEAGDVKFRHFDIDAGSSKLDLTLNLEQNPDGGADAWFEYSTDLFDRSTIVRFVEEFERVLQHVVSGPECRVSELPVFSSPTPATPAQMGLRREVIANQTATPRTVACEKSDEKVQTELGRIWCEVLGVATVRPEDNLFDLGGHSLLITRIVSRIRKSFGVEIPIYTFFDSPRLADIARVIETSGTRVGAASIQ
jgi:acyl carrier protein